MNKKQATKKIVPFVQFRSSPTNFFGKNTPEGLCIKCLKWPCEFLNDMGEGFNEEVTWCKDILEQGAKIKLMADGIKNGKPLLIAGKKYIVEGIKEKRIIEGYYIRIKGEKEFVPKRLAQFETKKVNQSAKEKIKKGLAS